jgi:hypothetical protein
MDLNHIVETFLTGIAGVLTALQGPAVVEFVKAKLSKHTVEEKEKDPIKSELEYSCIINDELELIREELEADRCWISMFHNGGHFLHGNKSMQKFSIMFETTAPGVSGVGMIFKNIPASLFSKSIEEIIKNKHIYISDYLDPKVATFGLKEGATASGTRSSYAVGLFDLISGQCIGTLGIDYIDQKDLDPDMKSLLNEKSQRVCGFLSSFIRTT